MSAGEKVVIVVVKKYENFKVSVKCSVRLPNPSHCYFMDTFLMLLRNLNIASYYFSTTSQYYFPSSVALFFESLFRPNQWLYRLPPRK